jgi:hypothetical protein
MDEAIAGDPIIDKYLLQEDSGSLIEARQEGRYVGTQVLTVQQTFVSRARLCNASSIKNMGDTGATYQLFKYLETSFHATKVI